MRTLLGVFGAVGRWPDWERFFARGTGGLLGSFGALVVCFPALWLVVTESLRAGAPPDEPRLDSYVPPEPEPALFALIVALWLASFTVTATLIAVLMRRTERLRLWLIARNWAVAWLCLALGAVFALVRFTPLPFAVGSGALFAAYLGLLPVDIRLAQRAAGFAPMTAILAGCVVVSTSLVVLLTGVRLALQ